MILSQVMSSKMWYYQKLLIKLQEPKKYTCEVQALGLKELDSKLVHSVFWQWTSETKPFLVSAIKYNENCIRKKKERKI